MAPEVVFRAGARDRVSVRTGSTRFAMYQGSSGKQCRTERLPSRVELWDFVKPSTLRSFVYCTENGPRPMSESTGSIQFLREMMKSVDAFQFYCQR